MKPDLVKEHVLHALQTLADFASRSSLKAVQIEIEACIRRIERIPAERPRWAHEIDDDPWSGESDP